jgi:serine/threonine protein kinase
MTPSANGLRLGSGDVLEGRYRIEEKLGEGGFGAVFRATQLNIDRKVAIKVVQPQLLAMGSGLERFLREAKVAQRLEHPNIVRMYDFGHTEDGTPYIAWELLKGKPLDAILEEGIPVAPSRVVRICLQVLKALMEAHAQGIVHRDIKPANIFLSEFSGEPDFVKVLDFGIAKALDVTEDNKSKALTMAGQIIGTPNYMAPEQVEGKAVGPGADLYSLGLVMAELLTGQAVFQGTGLAVCAAQLSPEPVPLRPDVANGPLGRVIWRATQKRLDERYPSARDMLDDLKQVARELGEDTTFGGFSGIQSQPGATSRVASAGGVSGSGAGSFAAPTSSPGAVVSPSSQPAVLQPLGGATGGGLLPGAKGSSKFLFIVLGGLAGLAVFGVVAVVVVAIALNGDDSGGGSTTGQLGQTGQNGQTTTQPQVGGYDGQGYPPHWGPQQTWGGGTAPLDFSRVNTANLPAVTPDLIAQRLQGAGWMLTSQPIVQNTGNVSTIVISAMRGQIVASVMLYDYGPMPFAVDALYQSLSQMPGAVVRNGSRVLYARVMSDNGTYESQQLIALILQ